MLSPRPASEEVARRWIDRWKRACEHYGELCAAALSEGDVDSARFYAKRWASSDERRWGVLGWMFLFREKRLQSRSVAEIDWFGEG